MLAILHFPVQQILLQTDERLSHGLTNIYVVPVELTMQTFEEIALATQLCVPLFWKRYVNDTALPTNQIDIFLIHLTSISSNVKLTYEREENNCIQFLDLLIK